MRKLLALLLTLAMTLSLLSVGLVSASAEMPAGAIAIDTYEELAAMKAGNYYYLTDDITVGSPTILEDQAEENIGTQAAVKTAGTEEDIITIPEGATLDGNGYTIYQGFYIQNPGWHTETNKFSNSLAWTHSMFQLSSGKQITLKNLKIGSADLPVYLSKGGATADETFTKNDTYSIFYDVAGSDVVWENVNIYVERYGRGLGSYNTAGVMFKVLGTHDFDNCSVNTSMLSAGSQCGGWFYNVAAGSSLNMNNCTLDGFSIATNVAGNEFITPTVSGSYVGGFVNYAYAGVTMKNCTNNVKTDCTYSSVGGQWSAFISYFQKGALSMENCVNNGNISTGKLTIGGAICGRTGSAANITSFRLINCVNNGNISCSGSTTSNNGFGGITGHTASDGVYEVNGCVNNGDVAGTGNVGGIIGFADGSATKTIKNCVNNGDLSATDNADAGGIIAQVRGPATIENCKNYGAVNCTNYNGGIVGQAYNASTYTITGCENFGTIGNTSTTYAAGILSYATDNEVEVTITNSANYGKIVSNQYSGGFVAENRNSLTISNSANYGEVAGVHAVGGFVGQSTNETTTTATLINCLNAGYIHEGPAAGEGIGGFFGRVAGTNAVISLTNCANIGTIDGSTKKSAEVGAFGDTFGQFIGLYTASAASYHYAGSNRIAGFHDWDAASATKPTLTNCYAYGTAVVADGAVSLAAWQTADAQGRNYQKYTAAELPEGYDLGTPATTADEFGYYMVVATKSGADDITYYKLNNDETLYTKAIDTSKYELLDVPATLHDNGIVGINVQYTGTVKTEATLDDLAALETELGIEFMNGTAEEDKIVVATPALRGYQMSTDGTSIRFLSTISSLNYANVGYTYSLKLNGAELITDKKVTTTNVLESINAVEGEGNMTTKSAAEIGGKYIVALTFINVPAEGTVVLTLTPDAGDFSGTTYEITIEDGVLTGCVDNHEGGITQ